MGAERAATSTIPPEDSGTDGPERHIRAVSLLLIAAFVILASLGLLGVRTTTATASDNGFSIAVLHAAVARPGLAAPFSVEVSSDDGSALPSEVTVNVASSYLAMFDDNGMEPTPASSFNTSELTSWTFDIPPGSPSLRVDLDARIEPAVQWGEEAWAAAEIDDVEVVRVAFSTWVMP